LVQHSDQRGSYFSDTARTFNIINYLHWKLLHCGIPDHQIDCTVGTCVIGITMCQQLD